MIYSSGPAIRSGEMTPRDVIAFCGELGLASVDTMSALGDDPWPDVRKWVEDAGMFVACHIASTDLATMDEAQRGQNMDLVRASVDDTAALGTDKLMLVIGSVPEGGDRATAQRRIGEALAQLCEKA